MPVQLAYEIGRCIIKAAGAISDAAHINSRYENVDGNDVEDTEENCKGKNERRSFSNFLKDNSKEHTSTCRQS